MNKKIPPQLLLLTIIAQNRNGLSISDLVNILRSMRNRSGGDVYYYYNLNSRVSIGIPNDVIQDINILKLLELVEEREGKLIATQKAYDILSKLKAR